MAELQLRRLCAGFVGGFCLVFLTIYVLDSTPGYLRYSLNNNTLSASLAAHNLTQAASAGVLNSRVQASVNLSVNGARKTASQRRQNQHRNVLPRTGANGTTSLPRLLQSTQTSLSQSYASHMTTSFPKLYSTPQTTTLPPFLRTNRYEPRPLTELDEGSGKVRVVLHAKLRTGSSFASEFFNKNPDFFYVFEPLVMATQEERVHPADCIQRTLTCQFEELWRMGLNNPIHSPRSLPGWKRKIFCYKYDQSDACALAPMVDIEKNCTGFAAMATKVIRVPSLQELRYLMTSGVKVIHVVRDPRAVVNSRVHILVDIEPNMKSFRRNTNWAREYCNTLQVDLNQAKDMFGDRRLPDSIPYTLVRYEDLVLNPLREVERMYNITDLKPHPDVYTWIEAFRTGSVHVNDPNAVRQPLFSTIRINASMAVDQWRRKMPWTLVNDIQNVCGDVMETLGYNKLNSNSDLDDTALVTTRDVDLECLYKKC